MDKLIYMLQYIFFWASPTNPTKPISTNYPLLPTQVQHFWLIWILLEINFNFLCQNFQITVKQNSTLFSTWAFWFVNELCTPINESLLNNCCYLIMPYRNMTPRQTHCVVKHPFYCANIYHDDIQYTIEAYNLKICLKAGE